MTDVKNATADLELVETLKAVNKADIVVSNNDILLRNISQTVIAAIVLLVWAGTIIAILAWTIAKGKGSGEFVCNTPPVKDATVGTDCTNGWIATRDQLKDVFTTGILPFLTLVMGFYFGQKSSAPLSGPRA